MGKIEDKGLRSRIMVEEYTGGLVRRQYGLA